MVRISSSTAIPFGVLQSVSLNWVIKALLHSFLLKEAFPSFLILFEFLEWVIIGLTVPATKISKHNFLWYFSFKSDLYVNIFLGYRLVSWCFGDVFVASIWVIHFFLIFPSDLCAFCDLAAGIKAWQLIYKANLVEWFICWLQGSREFRASEIVWVKWFASIKLFYMIINDFYFIGFYSSLNNVLNK